ncbi:MAG: DUF4377 domain-containing protein [Gammaproteobacteria bacterium]
MDIRIAATAFIMIGLAACSRGPAPPVPAAAPVGIEKTFFVAAERKPCTGVGPMECLRVREERVTNPPADGSSLRWTLVRVVSKQAVTSVPTP